MKIEDVSDVFQSKLRLSIVAALMTGSKTFNQLKEITNATDGNLSIQLKNLKNKNMISEKKEYLSRRQSTSYCITHFGKNIFKEYVEALQYILKESQKLNGGDLI